MPGIPNQENTHPDVSPNMRPPSDIEINGVFDAVAELSGQIDNPEVYNQACYISTYRGASTSVSVIQPPVKEYKAGEGVRHNEALSISLSCLDSTDPEDPDNNRVYCQDSPDTTTFRFIRTASGSILVHKDLPFESGRIQSLARVAMITDPFYGQYFYDPYDEESYAAYVQGYDERSELLNQKEKALTASVKNDEFDMGMNTVHSSDIQELLETLKLCKVDQYYLRLVESARKSTAAYQRALRLKGFARKLKTALSRN